MKRSTKGSNFKLILILISAAVICFGLGLAFQVYIAHGMHSALIKPNDNRPSNGIPVTRSEVEPPSSPQIIQEGGDSSVYVRETSVVSRTSTKPLVNLHKDPRSFRYRDILTLPPIVQAWRQAKVDWHEIIPQHLSNWERFGASQGLSLLVSKEVQLTNYLTRMDESGLLDKYGSDFGPLAAYSGCNIMSDSCMIHDEVTCRKNQLCVWDKSSDVCYDYGSPKLKMTKSEQLAVMKETNKVPKCKDPVNLNNRGKNAACDIYVDQPSVLLSVDSESQAMFYHWLASWSTILDDYYSGKSEGRRDTHYLLGNMQDPSLFGFLGTLSDFCWRRAKVQVPQDVCFCNHHSKTAAQSRNQPKRTVDQIVNALGLQDVEPPEDRVKVGIISRKRKRFILNEYDLTDICNDMGYECILLPLEYMTIYEQVKEFRSLDVLIGMHGSGLDNVIFLHPGSVLVQLMPWKNEHRASFVSSTRTANVVYQEYQVTDRQNTVLHWDLYAQANTEKLKRDGKEKIENRGQRGDGERETLMFWINQDIIVPEAEWKEVVVKAIRASQASKRNIDISSRL